MIINLTLSDLTNSKYTRVSEVGVLLKVLLAAHCAFDDEIATTNDVEEIVRLRLEQEKTGEVFQRLMDTVSAAKEGRGV